MEEWTLSLASKAAKGKKDRSNGKGYKNLGLLPYAPPSSQPQPYLISEFPSFNICVKQDVFPIGTGWWKGDFRSFLANKHQASKEVDPQSPPCPPKANLSSWEPKA